MKILLIAAIEVDSPAGFGYGNAADGLFLILQKLKEDNYISLLDIINPNNITNQKISLKEYDYSIVLANPNLFDNPSIHTLYTKIMSLCKKRYLYLFWETKPLPNWAVLTSELFNGFIAPSDFIKKQVESQTNKECFYFPVYVDFNNFKMLDIQSKKKSKEFKVLYIGQNTKRKGLEDAIISFIRVFHDKEDAVLIVKSYQLTNTEDKIETIINRIVDLNSNGNLRCKIYSLEKSLSYEELEILYKDSSLLLFPSRGEGFGLPLIEAGLYGIPSLYVPWSSSVEIANSSYNTKIDYFVDEAYSMFQYGYAYNTMYAVPLISSIMEGLEYYYYKWKEDKEEYYRGAVDNRKQIESKFNENICLEYMKNVLEI